MTRVPRVLAVGHEATRTGSPLVFLSLLREMQRRGAWSFDVVLARGGDLEGDFRELDPHARRLDLDLYDNRVDLVRRITRVDRLGAPGRGLLDKLRRLRRVTPRASDVVYVNSTPALGAVRWDRPHPPVLFHVHELASAREQSLPASDRHLIRTVPTAWVAASDAVATDLAAQEGVAPSRITVVREFPVVSQGAPSSSDVASARALIGAEATTRVVLACGTSDFRKGSDLFLQTALASRLLRPDLDVRWVWLGNGPYAHDDRRMTEEIVAAGADDFLRVVPRVADVRPFFAIADVFCLTSREDPYPLVMLEAALFECPTVAFEASGGASEFVRMGGGVLVPHLNAAAMALSINELLEDDVRRSNLGAEAARFVREHHGVAIAADQIEALLRHVMATD